MIRTQSVSHWVVCWMRLSGDQPITPRQPPGAFIAPDVRVMPPSRPSDPDKPTTTGGSDGCGPCWARDGVPAFLYLRYGPDGFLNLLIKQGKVHLCLVASVW